MVKIAEEYEGKWEPSSQLSSNNADTTNGYSIPWLMELIDQRGKFQISLLPLPLLQLMISSLKRLKLIFQYLWRLRFLLPKLFLKVLQRLTMFLQKLTTY